MKFNFLKLSTFTLLGVFLLSTFACKSDRTAELPTPDDRIIWTGGTLTFEKGDNADPTQAANQDRITDNVWITRGNEGGQIYNAKVENEFNKANSPEGTQWAIGTIANIDDLDFKSFRDAVDSPKSVVGKDLVVFLPDDNVFFSLKFTQWSNDKAGGFTYERGIE